MTCWLVSIVGAARSLNGRLDPSKESTEGLRAIVPPVQRRLADSVTIGNRYLADLRTGHGRPEQQVDWEGAASGIPIEAVK
jgi:hypothetical protein